MECANARVYKDDELLTTKEGASEIRVSKHTISAWFSRGILRRTKVGGKTFVRRSELLKMVQDQQ